MQLLSLMKRNDGAPEVAAISPRHEMGAYEALWLEKGASFKTMAEKFAADPKGAAVRLRIVPNKPTNARPKCCGR